MAHRGRLNVLRNILEKPAEEIFSEFESCYDPQDLVGSGDVKYHIGYLTEQKLDENASLTLYLVSNPSPLEAVNPVVEGIARARQDRLAADGDKAVLPVLLHGDAAFAGQGLVAETLNMSQLKGYRTGGTIHVIINNQIGYITLPEDARSTRYSTDVAKMLMVPIFHVHGEDPEAVVHVARLAADYRYRFGKDVVVDHLLNKVEKGGKVVFVDYAQPKRWHPLKWLTGFIFDWLEPFAKTLWYKEIREFAREADRFSWRRETIFGDLFQKVVATRES